MINFLIKFFNISSVIFLLNLLTFNLFTKILPLNYALISTLIIIFVFNFLFIIYSFNIGKNKTFFLIGLFFISIFFRLIEYNLFIRLIEIFTDPTLTWLVSITVSFLIKIFIYNRYFNLTLFKLQNEKKKIFIFSPTLRKGGAEKNIYILTKYFEPKKFDVNLILWSKSNIKINGVKKKIIKKKKFTNIIFHNFIINY